jgi:TPR repeat protein
VEPDGNESIKWLTKSALQEDPWAQFTLGTIYSKGDLVDQDFSKALKWYKKAADHRLGPALYQLGYFYEQGFGGEKNKIQAAKYYSEAIKEGMTSPNDPTSLFKEVLGR